jgi:Glycosyltransferases involved in cell wall biogenesis
MKVSIITTCYNRVNTIRESIESVLAQDYPNIEYIVVDGASTDGTVELVRRYEERLAVFVSEPDRGMYEAINKGIRLATGDIVGLMHSDDVFYDHRVVSRIVDAFLLHDPEMLYGNGLFVDPAKQNRVVRNWISGQSYQRRFKAGWLPLHTTAYFRNDVLGRYGLYNETYRIAADSELLTRYMYKYKIQTYYLNRYIVKMKIGGASTTPKKILTKWNEDIRVYKRHNLKPYIALPGKILSKLPQLLYKRRRR